MSPKLGLRCLLGGALMGLANLVPGISGGTMLLAAGIYPRFIQALADLSGIAPRMSVEPDRAVCYGAALQCAIELAAMGKAATIGGRAIPTPQAMVREVTTHGVGSRPGSLAQLVGITWLKGMVFFSGRKPSTSAY